MGGAGKQTATRRARNKVKGEAKGILAEAQNEGNQAVKLFLAETPNLKLAQIVGVLGGGYYNIKFGEEEPSIRGKADMKAIGSRKVKHVLKKVNAAEIPKEGDFVIVDWDKAQAEKNEAIAAVNKKHKKAAANIIAIVPDEQEVRVKAKAKWGEGGVNAVINDFIGMAAKPANSANSSEKNKSRKNRRPKGNANNND
jgi:hypothetical protein